MIDIVPVWEKGLFGSNIHVRINDDTVAVDHEEFYDRFDLEGSCDGTKYLPDGSKRSLSNGHGTSVASILAASGNNGVCSVGISPGITFSVCHAFGGGSNATFLGEKLDHVDISSNSYGTPACHPVEEDYTLLFPSERRGRRDLLQSSPLDTSRTATKSTTCPFTGHNIFATNPCDVCNFKKKNKKKKLSRACEISIIHHCQQFYKEDSLACVEFLDLLIDGGECEYNTLSDGQLQALSKGVTHGRNGKGIIFVIASGNDLIAGGDTNFEGFSNTRLTISVGAVGKDGLHSSYSNGGASLFVCAPGGDHEFITNHVTAFVGGRCNDAGVGTSFSCPIVSGVIALMLESNPNLTWRDVQGIIALTSIIPYDPDDDTSAVNTAGYKHSNYYGFGIINANNAVNFAETWNNFPPEHMLVEDTGILNIPILDQKSSWALSKASIEDTNTNYDGFFSEAVVVLLDIRHFSRGDLDIILTSPTGTVSVLHPGKRPENTQLDLDDRWKLMTVRNWGESPFGTWTLNVTDVNPGDLSECADHLWDLETPGRTVNCKFFEKRKYCLDGRVDAEEIAADGNSALLSLTDEDRGLTFEEACCACGGGRRRGEGNFLDLVVQWRIVVYGHWIGMPNTVEPSDAPSRFPSGTPSKAPTRSQYPSATPSSSQHPSSSAFPSSSTYPSESPSSSRYPTVSNSPSTTTPSTSRHPTESAYPTTSFYPSTSAHPTTSLEPTVSISTSPSSSANRIRITSEHPTSDPSNLPSAATTEPTTSPEMDISDLPSESPSSAQSSAVPSQRPSRRQFFDTLEIAPQISKDVSRSPNLVSNNIQPSSQPTAERIPASDEQTAKFVSSGTKPCRIFSISASALSLHLLLLWPMYRI